MKLSRIFVTAVWATLIAIGLRYLPVTALVVSFLFPWIVGVVWFGRTLRACSRHPGAMGLVFLDELRWLGDESPHN